MYGTHTQSMRKALCLVYAKALLIVRQPPNRTYKIMRMNTAQLYAHLYI